MLNQAALEALAGLDFLAAAAALPLLLRLLAETVGRFSLEPVALPLVRSAHFLAFFAMLTVAFSTAQLGTRHPLYQQLCWRPVSAVVGQAQPPWGPAEAGQAQPPWVPEPPEAVDQTLAF